MSQNVLIYRLNDIKLYFEQNCNQYLLVWEQGANALSYLNMIFLHYKCVFEDYGIFKVYIWYIHATTQFFIRNGGMIAVNQ